MFMFLAYISLINLASTSEKVNPIRAKKSEKAQRNGLRGVAQNRAWAKAREWQGELKIEAENGGGGAKSGGFVGGGGLEAGEKEFVGLGVVGGDEFE